MIPSNWINVDGIKRPSLECKKDLIEDVIDPELKTIKSAMRKAGSDYYDDFARRSES